MSTWAYRITIDLPEAWAGETPDAVQDALDLMPDAWQDTFLDRRAASNRAAFWKRMGASSEVQKSNPVTWPARTLDGTS
jgi:hypothetical protein